MPATHEFKPVFTSTDEIVDPKTDDYTGDVIEEDENDPIAEDEYDMEAVTACLERLQTQFKTLAAVRPTCEDVQLLLDVTGHNSWRDFQVHFKDELAEYFAPTPEKLIENHDRSMLIRAEARRDAVKEKIKAQELACKQYNTQRKAIEAKLSAAEMDELATEGLEWDAEAHKRHLSAQKVVLHCKMTLKQMASKNPEQMLKQLYLNLRYHEGAVKFAAGAVQGNYRVLINTGDPKEDARLYGKVGESCVWELNRLFEKEITIEKRMAEERYSGADYGIARITDAPFESTSGGVYRAPIDDLTELRDQLEEQFATYASCQAGYELAATAFVPKYDNEWFPTWMELSQALANAKQRARQAQINRARSQLETYKELIKR